MHKNMLLSWGDIGDRERTALSSFEPGPSTPITMVLTPQEIPPVPRRFPPHARGAEEGATNAYPFS